MQKVVISGFENFFSSNKNMYEVGMILALMNVVADKNSTAAIKAISEVKDQEMRKILFHMFAFVLFREDILGKIYTLARVAMEEMDQLGSDKAKLEEITQAFREGSDMSKFFDEKNAMQEADETPDEAKDEIIRKMVKATINKVTGGRVGVVQGSLQTNVSSNPNDLFHNFLGRLSQNKKKEEN